jgi:excinuclease ABC subunit A
MKKSDSETADFLFGRQEIHIPRIRRKKMGELKILGAEENNLKNIDVTIPLSCFVGISGVSGSGKSSLISRILVPTLARELNRAQKPSGKHREITGIKENLDKLISIDQSPIGRTPRSNAATYTGVFTDIREVFAATTEARIRGYKSSRFSFNVKGGRCEACNGDGLKKIEMHFLPDVYIPCEACGGKKYNDETLEVTYRGKSIFDILDMTVEEAVEFFENFETIQQKLVALNEVGLGYIKLGQPAPTLSGGEAQRVKLASELMKKQTGKTIYVLDEPTTGLHFSDVKKLLSVLQKLVDKGNSMLVIEHNLDVLKCCDYIVDIGPEGGEKGGTLVAHGTPEEVAKVKESYTGKYLAEVLK